MQVIANFLGYFMIDYKTSVDSLSAKFLKFLPSRRFTIFIINHYSDTRKGIQNVIYTLFPRFSAMPYKYFPTPTPTPTPPIPPP